MTLGQLLKVCPGLLHELFCMNPHQLSTLMRLLGYISVLPPLDISFPNFHSPGCALALTRRSGRAAGSWFWHGKETVWKQSTCPDFPLLASTRKKERSVPSTAPRREVGPQERIYHCTPSTWSSQCNQSIHAY